MFFDHVRHNAETGVSWILGVFLGYCAYWATHGKHDETLQKKTSCRIHSEPHLSFFKSLPGVRPIWNKVSSLYPKLKILAVDVLHQGPEQDPALSFMWHRDTGSVGVNPEGHDFKLTFIVKLKSEDLRRHLMQTDGVAGCVSGLTACIRVSPEIPNT